MPPLLEASLVDCFRLASAVVAEDLPLHPALEVEEVVAEVEVRSWLFGFNVLPNALSLLSDRAAVAREVLRVTRLSETYVWVWQLWRQAEEVFVWRMRSVHTQGNVCECNVP